MTASPTPTDTAGRLPYLPGVDGLRALAVVAVVVYHAEKNVLPGGFLGVEVFFVVSGYLITTLLVLERQSRGHVDLLAFWVRRAGRLLPLLFVSIAGTLLATLVLGRDVLGRAVRDAFAAVGYVSNWYLVARGESYFESFNRPSPLRHLWSLAIEEQFYLVWPIVLGLLLALVRRPRLAAATIAAGAVASTWWMAQQYVPFTDPSRVYYGTDTRLSGLLLGSALALVVRPWEHDLSARRQYQLSAVGGFGAVALAVLMLQVHELTPWLYRGGFLVVDVLTAAVVVGVACRRGWLTVVLGTRPLVWIGTRSYAIYLVHWPVIVFTRPGVDISLTGVPLLLYRLVLTLVLAELAHRLVEIPWRDRVRSAFARDRAATARQLRFLGYGVVATAALAFLTTTSTADPGGITVDAEGNVVVAAATEVNTTTVPAPGPNLGPVTTTTRPPPPPRVLMIGDSVALGARDALVSALGADAVVDATVGRQFASLRDVLRGYQQRGQLASTIVIHLGNNGPLSTKGLVSVVEELPVGTGVVLVNVRVRQPWEAEVNNAVREVADRYDNIVLIDWWEASKWHGDWFAKDGVHLNQAGSRTMAQLVVDAVASLGAGAPAGTTASVATTAAPGG
jgi:peptidoglycan/LPS O-acetylase OafA/YrhL